MLSSIYIKNFAIIDKLEIDFHENMSVLTGETGAGKSILIDAINIVFGNKKTNKIMRNENLETEIVCQFHITNKNVLDLVKEIKKNWQGVDWKIKKNTKLKNKESNLLKLNSNKAKKILKWYPVLNFENSIKFTANWYKQYNYIQKANTKLISKENIIEYNKLLKKET